MKHHCRIITVLGTLMVLSAGAHDHVHHWEVPSRDPDRIVLTLPGDPATTAAVTWRTDVSVENAFLELAKETGAPRFDLGNTRYPAITENLSYETVTKWNSTNSALANYHSVSLSDLDPDTLYCYRIGDGGEFWSEWIQFRTAPDQEAPLTFLYFGDVQNARLSHCSRVIRAAYRKAPYARFSLYAGDLINVTNRDSDWAEWCKAGSWLHAGIPVLPVTGNHEYIYKNKKLSLHWRPQFTLPVVAEVPSKLAETVYTLEFPNLRIIVLNSNRNQKGQVDWLESVLKENDSRWVVVSFHHPLYSSGKDRDNEELRTLWKPIFDKYSVDLILQGHDHTYARGQSVPQVPVHKAEKEAGSETVQTVYVNSVVGPKQYGFSPEIWDKGKEDNVTLQRKAENTQFYQVIKIDGRELEYRSYTAADELYDGFNLTKADDGTKTIKQLDNLPATRMFDNSEPYSSDNLD